MRVWIDTDLALGAERGDVDDGFAIAAVFGAAKRGKLEILGISAASGNTTGAIAHRAAQDLVKAADLSLPVIAEQEAPELIAALPNETVLLAIGPPSNIVRAAKIDPSLPSRTAAHVVGTVTSRRAHPILALFDLNFRYDKAAADIFWTLPFARRVVYPLDVVRSLRFGRREMAQIGSRSALGEYLERGSRRWLRIAWRRYGATSFPVWDLVAALGAIDELPRSSYAGERLRGFDARAAFAAFLALL